MKVRALRRLSQVLPCLSWAPHDRTDAVTQSFRLWRPFFMLIKRFLFLSAQVDKGCSPLWWPLFTGLISFLSSSRQSLVAIACVMRVTSILLPLWSFVPLPMLSTIPTWLIYQLWWGHEYPCQQGWFTSSVIGDCFLSGTSFCSLVKFIYI